MAGYWDQYHFLLTPEEALAPMPYQPEGRTATANPTTTLSQLPGQQPGPGSIPVRWYNPDQPYAPQTDAAIRQWSATAGGMQPPAATQPASKDAVLKFIADWQGSHPATRESFEQLSNALQTQFGVSRFDYNGTPSNNEFLINGEKVKVMGGEDSATPSWFAYGSDDGGGTGGLPPGYSTTGQNGVAGFSAPGLAAPFTELFQSPGNFTMPALNEQTDPGFAARMKMGLDAIQRSAAAKGTLLNAGTMKDLNGWAQDYASSEYGKVFDRALTTNDTAYNRAYNEYLTREGIWGRNANRTYDFLSGQARQGLDAASQAGAFATGYGTNTGNLQTGQANANANAEISRGNTTTTTLNQLPTLVAPLIPTRRAAPSAPGIDNPIGYDENL